MNQIIPQGLVSVLLEEVSALGGLEQAALRRHALVEEMSALDALGKSCLSCSGMCCTNQHNSMQVDPIQALELLAWLEGQGRINEALFESLDKNISEYRLDREFFLGRGRELRQHFTCPFYLGKSKGCSVSRGAKPYGCLGFNPLEENVSTPGKCASNINALEKRDEKFSLSEAKANEIIKDKLGIYWEKKNLPFALKDMLRALGRKVS